MSIIIGIAIVLASSLALSAQEMRIDKIEPPNWWSGMKYNELELMVYGKSLRDVSATFDDSRISVRSIDARGDYAFVQISLAPDLPPGDYAIRLRPSNSTQPPLALKFPVFDRERSSSRHQGFEPKDVVYLITPDRFANGDPTNDRMAGTVDEYDPSNVAMRHGGDLQGIIDHLDYLEDLGITAIWLNPVLENRGVNSYHGYKATDLYQVDPRFGTNELYKQFVQQAQRRGIKVIFDHVSNHVGIRHPWIDSLPTKTWLNGSVDDHLREKHYLLSLADPHGDPKSRHELKTFWFVDKMPDLNQRDPHLGKYLIQNTLWWIEYTGLDGIREDTYPYADQEFLAKWAKAIRDEYPKFNIVGEIWATQSAYIAKFQDRTILPRSFETHLPAVMHFPLMQAYRSFLSGNGKLRDIYDIYAQDFLFTDLDNLMVFADNHDTPRMMFEAGGNKERVKLILTLLLTSRGIPQILYGTELGMLGGKSHVELRADFPGGFPEDRHSGFTATGRSQLENEMHSHVKQLISLRKKHPALHRGKMWQYSPTWKSDIYRVVRQAEGDKILVIANGHDTERRSSLSDLAHHLNGGQLKDLQTGEITEWRTGVVLRPTTARIFEIVPQP